MTSVSGGVGRRLASFSWESILARQLQEIHAGIARLAAPETPGRIVDARRRMHVPAAFDQALHMHIEAEAAAELAGPAAIGPHAAPLDHHRVFISIASMLPWRTSP